MLEKQNYIDERGNYHNNLNLTLAQIYDSGVDFGRKVAEENYIKELEKLIGTMLQNMQIISGEFGNQLTNEQESYNDGLRKGIELIREKISELK